MSLKEQVDQSALPKHIAVIMDGNGRWARKRGNMRDTSGERGKRELVIHLRCQIGGRLRYRTEVDVEYEGGKCWTNGGVSLLGHCWQVFGDFFGVIMSFSDKFQAVTMIACDTR